MYTLTTLDVNVAAMISKFTNIMNIGEDDSEIDINEFVRRAKQRQTELRPVKCGGFISPR